MKRKLGHTQGRLPPPKTNLRTFRPKDFLRESFLAEFTMAPFFTVLRYSYSGQGFDALEMPEVSNT